jgi:Flp pilus assembly protein TadB
MRVWLSKPIYEVLPYYYMAAGLVVLSAAVYVNYWIWPLVCAAVGTLCLATGARVWWMRRVHRRRRRRNGDPLARTRV